MMKSRLVAITMAGIFVSSFSPYGWAQDTAPKAGPAGCSTAGSVISNMIYIPGKAVSCAVSGVLWTAVMVLTAGTMYKQAGDMVRDTCTGKWVLTGEDMEEPAEEDM
jgi:hypothetical protein